MDMGILDFRSGLLKLFFFEKIEKSYGKVCL